MSLNTNAQPRVKKFETHSIKLIKKFFIFKGESKLITDRHTTFKAM